MMHRPIHIHRRLQHLWILLSCALFFQACKKDVDVIDGFTEPVFKMSYNAGGGAIALQAGVANVYHFTGYHYTQEYMYCGGAFALATCPAADCPGSLRIEIKNEAPGQVVETALFDPATIPYYLDGAEGKAIITWVDPQGRVWRSNLRQQESNAYFRIIQSEAYTNNEKGEKTWKAAVNFSCILYLDSGGEISFKGEGTMALAYP